MTKRGKWRRRLKWGLLGSVVLAVVLFASAWLAVQHLPGWYQPVEIAPEHLQAVRDDLVRTQNDFGERLALSDSPFEVKISQAQVNAWLAAREDIWPLSREWLPAGISGPFVQFGADGIRLGATCQVRSLQTVMSVLVQLSADAERLHFRVARVSSGSFPISVELLRGVLRRLEARGGQVWQRADVRKDDAAGSPSTSLSDLFEGVTLPNEGVWWEPRRAFRVTGARVEPPNLVLAIQPMPYRRAGAADSRHSIQFGSPVR